MLNVKLNMSKNVIQPDSYDDMRVEMIRMGKSEADKNFLMDDPRFTPEAMKKRSQLQSVKLLRNAKKGLLEKFGK